MNSINCTPFGSDYYCVMNGWEPKENEDGVIYFSNSHRKVTSWTHPYLEKIFEEMNELNEIRYAAYRTAMKLRYLQLKSGLSWITLRGIKRIWASKRELEDSYRESNVSHREAFNIIVSILESSDNLRLHRVHFSKAADIIVNLLIEIYDTNYEGRIALSSLKVFLTALCSAQLSEKYRIFYSEVYNSDEQMLQRERLLYLFYDLMQIVEILKENTAFGTNVSVAVDSCLKFYTAPSDNRRSSEDTFYSWLLLEPQIIVWLPTLHRVAATENTFHDVECSVCGVNPLKGFRYKCLQCFKFDMCQSCFFQGQVTLTHKLKHPIQEYCLPASRKDNTKAVLKILRNKLSKKHRSQSKITYLPLDDDSLTGSVFQWQPRYKRPHPKEVFCGSTDSGLACNSENSASASEDLSNFTENVKRVVGDQTKPRNDLGEHGSLRTSKFVNHDQLSKKEMIDQQIQMARKIEELQEENKFLHERLNKKGNAVSNHSISDQSQSVVAANEDELELADEQKDDNNYSAYQVDTVSPIVTSVDVESQEKRTEEHKECSKTDSDEGDSLPNIMEIVGYYTPVRSLSENLCEEDRAQMFEEGEEKEKAICSVKAPVNYTATEPLKCETEEELKESVKTDVEVALTTNQDKDDLTSESTASCGLEYGYSDMSLYSESISQSQKTVTKEKEMLAVPNDIISKKEYSEDPPDVKNVGSSADDKSDSNENALHSDDVIKLTKDDETVEKQSTANYEEPPSANNPDDKIIFKNPPQVGQMPSLSQTTEMNTNELFFDISNILHEGSALPVLTDTCNKPFTPGNGPKPETTERRMTLEPVFMSTPVMLGEDLTKSVEKNAKENKPPPGNKETTLQLIASYRYKATPSGVTPKLGIPSRQNRRLLSSHKNVSTYHTPGSVDLSHREVGMTTMFDKVERLGDLEMTSVGDSLAKGDKDEMEKLVHKLDTPSQSSPEYHQLKPGNNSSSMINAVFGVGHAMADLVQATADLQHK